MASEDKWTTGAGAGLYRDVDALVGRKPGRTDRVLAALRLGRLRRGRNRAGQGPRRGDAAAYGQATGFETLLGWLFLHDPGRLAELLDHLQENDP